MDDWYFISQADEAELRAMNINLQKAQWPTQSSGIILILMDSWLVRELSGRVFIRAVSSLLYAKSHGDIYSMSIHQVCSTRARCNRTKYYKYWCKSTFADAEKWWWSKGFTSVDLRGCDWIFYAMSFHDDWVINGFGLGLPMAVGFTSRSSATRSSVTCACPFVFACLYLIFDALQGIFKRKKKWLLIL